MKTDSKKKLEMVSKKCMEGKGKGVEIERNIQNYCAHLPAWLRAATDECGFSNSNQHLKHRFEQ